jgi:hypothetical protein
MKAIVIIKRNEEHKLKKNYGAIAQMNSNEEL